LIFLPPGTASESTPDYGSYGWENFTLTSNERKMHYLAVQVKLNLIRMANEDIANAVIREWLGVDLGDGKLYDDHSVDHQSVWTLPVSWDGKGIDKQFVEALSAFIQRDDLVVLGGNDNSDGHPLHREGSGNFSLPVDSYEMGSGSVCRYDQIGRYWTMFNRQTGAKMRFDLERNQSSVDPEFAQFPELIDIKITDFCDAGCAYCYQGSTPKGEHAEDCYWLIKALGKMKVFEVAIGGGEPTKHPEFADILRRFRYSHIVPNFTTKSTEWMENDKRLENILKEAGAVGFSIASVADINKLVEIVGEKLVRYDPWSRERGTFSFQYVMGSTNQREFLAILNRVAELNGRITLLDFKPVGRGAKFKPHDYTGWLGRVKTVVDDKGSGHLHIGIDTPLAARHQKDLEREEIPKWMYEIEEGRFSMYIDAVNMKVGPSSYCDPKLMVDLKCENREDHYYAEIGSIFRRFPDMLGESRAAKLRKRSL
jgi:MoaA/NifB/PqqE/SkfB family radical SAM enzyme